jgi:predicted nuclease of predicted toxin-antitoxin system
MRFILDSCISRFAVQDLRAGGFDVIWIPESGEDPGDEAIIRQAFEEDLILVTADKDFGELVFVFNEPHPTIIRLVDIRPKEQGDILLRLVSSHKDDLERKALITVDRTRIRVRFAEEPEE